MPSQASQALVTHASSQLPSTTPATLEDLSLDLKVRLCEFIDDTSLTRLARTNSCWTHPALHILYKRDARAKTFAARAILWAVKQGCLDSRVEPQTDTYKILRRAQNSGCGINEPSGSEEHYTTPLIAASSDDSPQHIIWVERLLFHGASMNNIAKPFPLPQTVRLGSLSASDPLPDLDIPQPIILRQIKYDLLEFLVTTQPLFIPLIQNNANVVRAMLDAGPPDLRLAWDSSPGLLGSAPSNVTLTVIHVLAMSGEDHMGMAKRLINRSEHLINEPLSTPRVQLVTPLHLAALSANAAVLPFLLDHEPDLEREMMPMGVTPLHTAIQTLSYDTSLKFQKIMKAIICHLLEAGANVNRVLALGSGFTPLMNLILQMRETARRSQPMKDIFQMLLKHGADPNIIAPNGHTALSLLAKTAIAELSQSDLQNDIYRFMKKLVDEHKANPNLVTGPLNPSILGHVYARDALTQANQKEQLKLLKALVALGARFTPREANLHFNAWTMNKDFRKWYDMTQEAQYITAPTIRKTYERALKEGIAPQNLANFLSAFTPSDPAYLVWLALDPENPYCLANIKTILRLPFPGAWRHPKTADTLIFQVLNRLIDKDACSPSLALTHLQLLRDKGVLVSPVGRLNLNPVQFIRKFRDKTNKNLSNVLLWLYEAIQDEKDGIPAVPPEMS